MVCAILFGFTGVIADDEAWHFQKRTTIHDPTLFPGIVEFANRARRNTDEPLPQKVSGNTSTMRCIGHNRAGLRSGSAG